MNRATPMRRTEMKRGGFKREQRRPLRAAEVDDVPRVDQPRPAPVRRGVMARIDDVVRAVVKDNAIQNKKYMDLVRLLPCARCSIVGFTQFCHSDEGKGKGIKTDCRRGWPGCGPHGNDMGCHHLLGSTGKLGKEERRRLEDEYAAKTRAVIRKVGLWPDDLPAWLPDADAANDSMPSGN